MRGLRPSAAPVGQVLAAVAAGEAVGWEKFVHGELDVAEDLAGVLLAAGATGTLLLRHAVVVGRHEELSLPLQADDGELAQGDIDPLVLPAEAQIAAKAGADTGRDLGELAVAGAALAHVHQLHAQDDWIYRFYHGSGEIALAHVLLVQAAEAGLGAEDLGVPLAAEEDDPLVKDAQAADLHRPGRPHKGVGGDPVEVADIHRVEAAVEAYRLHVDVNIEQFRRPGLDADGPLNGALRVLGRVEPKVLNAVLIGRYSIL